MSFLMEQRLAKRAATEKRVGGQVSRWDVVRTFRFVDSSSNSCEYIFDKNFSTSVFVNGGSCKIEIYDYHVWGVK